ncbi:MAG: BREX system ATP-binding domain-containing protein [Chloroflexota bacterium]
MHPDDFAPEQRPTPAAERFAEAAPTPSDQLPSSAVVEESGGDVHSGETVTRVQARRAIEALRAGVPNHDAVLALGGGQPRIEARFRQLLDSAADDIAKGTQTPGLLIAGDFGSGKSHLLEALEQTALRENFVCSKVVVSKETPLHDADKLYRAAMQAAVVPGKRGSALTELAFELKFDSQAYRDLVAWASEPSSGLGSRFPASLFVFEHSRDEEVRDRIISFWGGDPLDTRLLRGWLRDQGEAATYRLERIGKRELSLQYFSFASRLIAAAGYAGWVLLVDELELIAQYSFKARARAYAELARWSGRLRGQRSPGLVSLFAITHDFSTLVLHQRNDLERIPGRLRATENEADAAIAAGAEAGMRTIERDRVALSPPDLRGLDQLRERLRALHGLAYDWQPPDLDAGERATSTSMRQYVRRWINEWDLLRLYPEYRPAMVAERFELDYSENPDLEIDGGDESEAR